MQSKRTLNRRTFLQSLVGGTTATVAAIIFPHSAYALTSPGQAQSEIQRPQIPYGIASGDIGPDYAVIWSKTDRSAQMLVEVATSDRFADVRMLSGPIATEATDYTAKLELTGLPPGQEIFYRVRFQDPK